MSSSPAVQPAAASGSRKTVIVPKLAPVEDGIQPNATGKRTRSDIIVVEDEPDAKKLPRMLVEKSMLHERLLIEEIKLERMKELHGQPPLASGTSSRAAEGSGQLSREQVSSAGSLTAQVQQSLHPPSGPSATAAANETAAAPISISSRLQQVIDATALSNLSVGSKLAATTSADVSVASNLPLPVVRKVVKKNIEKKIFSVPYPKTYRQVWPIVPVNDTDFLKNFGLELVCNYFDSKWQMEQAAKQKHAASAANKPVCHQCNCDFASAWQVRKNNSHSLLLCESCDFKNLKTLQREKIANHLKDLKKIIQESSEIDYQSSAHGFDPMDVRSVRTVQGDSVRTSGSLKTKFRVEKLDEKMVIQTKQAAKATSSDTQVASKEEKKSKLLLNDKLEQISKQLLERRLQEGQVSTGNLLEQHCGVDNKSNLPDLSSPQRPRRKQVTPKAMRKQSTSDADSCNA